MYSKDIIHANNKNSSDESISEKYDINDCLSKYMEMSIMISHVARKHCSRALISLFFENILTMTMRQT